MGMRFVNPSKKARAFQALIAPITWFHSDASMQDNYKFKAHATKPDTILGYWAEDMNEYEIKCPPQLRDSILAALNNVNKVFVR